MPQKSVIATAAAAVLLTWTPARAQTLAIPRDSTVVPLAPTQNFTGAVRIETLFPAVDPSFASGGAVTFAAGARTAWHSHPRGQTLIVIAGTARVQRWGGPIEEAGTGAVVRIPPGEKHWHGAAPQTSMTHIAITEHRDGVAVQWMEAVTDSQYNAPLPAARPVASAAAQAQGQPSVPATTPPGGRPSGPQQQRLSPGLAQLTDDVLYGDVWTRPELSPRDRSLVVISTLIATGKTAQLAGHLGRALSNGVRPTEASGVLAHLAIYCGWPSAVSALEVYDQVYASRGVDSSGLRLAAERLAAPASDAARAKTIDDDLGPLAPKFTQLTNDVVFGDLWRRPDLTLRDRSLVTISAVAAMGDADQLDLYVRSGADSGLTGAQMAEAMAHLAFYAGWPRATKALTVIARVLGR